jgi:hypothetical protein
MGGLNRHAINGQNTVARAKSHITRVHQSIVLRSSLKPAKMICSITSFEGNRIHNDSSTG